jgi:uncharacterized membrane protein
MSQSVPAHPSRIGPVFLTIFGVLTIVALVAMPILAGAPPESGVPDLVRFFGRFHPLVLHLPIGMMVLVLITETGRLFAKDKSRNTGLAAIFLAAASAVVAVLLGFVLYYSAGGEYKKELAERHLYGGLLFACGVIVAFIVKVWVNYSSGRGNPLYWVILVGNSAVMGLASHDGASLTHGEGYLTKYAPPEVLRVLGMPATEKKEKRESAPDSTTPEDSPGAPAKAPGEKIVYSDVIVPILEQKCYSCHNAEKQKGKFRMDTYDLLVKGGKEGKDLVHGKSADSLMVVRIELPKDDDERMPPEGKKELTPDEVALIKWWIDSGASKDATLGSLQPADAVKASLAKLVPAGDTVKEKAAAVAEVKHAADKREAVKTEVEKLRKEFPAALNFESQTSPGLVFTAVSMRKNFGDNDLAKLKPVLSDMVSMDLSASTVTDSGAKMLEDAKGLKSLRLSETALTDAGMDTLAKLSNLESLNLYGTQVTNEGVEKLVSLTSLKKLYLWQTKVDPTEIEALKKKLPGCEIIVGL